VVSVATEVKYAKASSIQIVRLGWELVQCARLGLLRHVGEIAKVIVGVIPGFLTPDVLAVEELPLWVCRLIRHRRRAIDTMVIAEEA
jgi:hypothetical protein